ncbi:hypothetical protein E5A73_15595 [Sphingomonas gei]|uniref:Uncharacterized protein n=1 Tax=Sphingomonas gei TaxID=1395960 RepID=A0A4S1X7S8_9SPHN|nr:hypothetical protein [Sphingomonas gei]TGX52224.1 hypothetical protein E5A73_15595 [Sphingomonas gei]
MVTAIIGASVPGAKARAIGVDIATPGERRTDEACAAQDGATESLSQGLARHQGSAADLGRDGALDRLIQQPSALDRLTKAP